MTETDPTGRIQIVHSEEYILGYDALSAQPSRGDSGQDNVNFFEMDLRNGRLKKYTGSYVAYWKGVLCGQSRERDHLYNVVVSVHGRSNLAVFPVPENAEKQTVLKALEDALGEFRIHLYNS